MLLPLLALLTPEVLTFTSEEEGCFAREHGKPAPLRVALRIEGGRAVAIDAFGTPLPAQPPLRTEATTEGLRASLPDGTTTTLRRARPTTCWAAVKRDQAKPDGSEDWAFASGIKIHDQGGRARVGGDGAPAAVIRMRNVVWPSGTNRPSLVLYIHTPDAPDREVSYAWADPNAAPVGVNLRWIHAICTIDGRDGPVTPKGGNP